MSLQEIAELSLPIWRQNHLGYTCISNWNHDQCLVAVKRDGLWLQHIDSQSYEICLEAVRENGLALQYVRYQVHEICIAAVRQNGLALRYVQDRTTQICLESVKQNGAALQYVPIQTEEICIAAIKQDSFASVFVLIRTSLIEEVYRTRLLIEAIEYGLSEEYESDDSYYEYVNDDERVYEYESDDEYDPDIDSLFDNHIPEINPFPPILKTRIKDLLDSHTDSSKECSICYENNTRMGYRLLPCDHDLICIDCIDKLEQNLCPFCRTVIEDVIRI